jgi:hypothetical protein
VATLIVQPFCQKQSYTTAYHHKLLCSDMLQLNRTQGRTNLRHSVGSRDSLLTYLHSFVKSALNMEAFKQYSMPLCLFVEHLTKLSASQSLYCRMMECSKKQGLEKNVQESDRSLMSFCVTG